MGLAAVMAVVSGGILLATTTMGTGSPVALIPSAYADANCDKAGAEQNVQGNYRGNLKQCIGIPFFETDGEQLALATVQMLSRITTKTFLFTAKLGVTSPISETLLIICLLLFYSCYMPNTEECLTVFQCMATSLYN
ncbi:MAG: hypothetical protein ACJ70P_03070 [Nitrososphaera sp.]